MAVIIAVMKIVIITVTAAAVDVVIDTIMEDIIGKNIIKI